MRFLITGTDTSGSITVRRDTAAAALKKATEEGVELSTLEEVQEEAARTLADMMRDAVRQDLEDVGYPVAIEVRDDEGPVLQLKFTFEPGRRQ